MTADHKKWTRFVQTDDVYKSVQLQTGYRDVGSNTMKDKVTFTNEFEFIGTFFCLYSQTICGKS